MMRTFLLLLVGVLALGACKSHSDYKRAQTLEHMRRDLELPSEDWNAIIALAGMHTGHEINKAARVSNNTIYVTLVPSEGDSKSPGPTLVFVRTGDHWVENNVFNAGPMGPRK